MLPMSRLILASSSPRRHFLIQYLQQPFEVQEADVDEESVTHPEPATNALQTALLKARAVRVLGEGAIVIAADTIVAMNGEIFGKPANAAEAGRMLRRLRGRTHHVHTGIALVERASRRMEGEASAVTTDASTVTMDVSTTHVTMRDYSDEAIETYVAGGDPLDKAGAYAIQHRGFSPVARLEGCYTGVMGLPLCTLRSALEQLGVNVDLAVDTLRSDYGRCPTCLSLMDTESGPYS